MRSQVGTLSTNIRFSRNCFRNGERGWKNSIETMTLLFLFSKNGYIRKDFIYNEIFERSAENNTAKFSWLVTLHEPDVSFRLSLFLCFI